MPRVLKTWRWGYKDALGCWGVEVRYWGAQGDEGLGVGVLGGVQGAGD